MTVIGPNCARSAPSSLGRIWILTVAVVTAACSGAPPAPPLCEAPKAGGRGEALVYHAPLSARAAGYPLTGDRLVRHDKNPVITGADLSPNHTLVADPFLLVADDRLYAFFEALHDPAPEDNCCGEIWMAESRDGLTWTGFQQVSKGERHYSHPHAFIHDGTVHVLYSNNARGTIYHRSSGLDEFPDWSRQREVFRGADHGWHHLVEFAVIPREGAWYLLGITGDGAREDRWIRGRWSPTLPRDWDTGSEEMSPCPLLDVGEQGWVDQIVELTPVEREGRLFLLMGAKRRLDGKRSIGTFAVTALSPGGLRGAWLEDDFTFPLAPAGWDDWDIHRASAVVFRDRWVYMYDGRRNDFKWKIGVATAPLD